MCEAILVSVIYSFALLSCCYFASVNVDGKIKKRQKFDIGVSFYHHRPLVTYRVEVGSVWFGLTKIEIRFR